MTITLIPTALAGVSVPRLPRPNHTLDALRTWGERNANTAEQELAATETATESDDLLDSVPVNHVADLRSPRQAELIDSLVGQIRELDVAAGEAAQAYTHKMTQHGRWTPGRDGNASAWITRMIAKVTELRAARPAQPTAPVEVPEGRYAVQHQGELKFFHVSIGNEGTKWAGFTFLDRRSSDDLWPIRNRETKAEVLALIAADLDTAELTYALKFKQCRKCHRGLTDQNNPYLAQGYGPDCGAKV